jgi:hypothetical protein
MNALSLTYIPEDDRHDELFAVVDSSGFRGSGSAWFRIDHLREFCRSIAAYPLPPGDEPKLEGGFFDDAGETLEQCHLSVRLSPHDPLGAVRVTASVSNQAPRDDDSELRQLLTCRFLVNYGDIARFRTELAAMVESNSGEATLMGTS